MPPLFISVDLDSECDEKSYSSLILLEHPLDCDPDDDYDNDIDMQSHQPDHDNHKKTVTFALHCTETYLVPHLNDLQQDNGDELMNDLYYSRPAIRAMKRAAMCTVQKLNLGLQVQESAHETVRGVQHLVLATATKRQALMRRRVQAVVQGQDNDDSDEQYLKRLSESYSRKSVQQAVTAAQLDAIFAESYLASTRLQQAALLVHNRTCTEGSADDEDAIPASLCLGFCTLRRSWTRFSGGGSRATASFPTTRAPTAAIDYVIPVV